MRTLIVSLVALVALNGCSAGSDTIVNGGLGAATSDHFTYIFAGGQYTGLYRSNDMGHTWVHTIGFPAVYPMDMVTKGKMMFASAYESVYASSDEGMTWEQLPINHGIVWGLAVFDSLLIAGTIDGCCVSTDDGASWAMTSTLTPTICPREYTSAQGVLFSAGGRGVAHSLDGKNWSQIDGIKDCYGIASDGTRLFLSTFFDGIKCSSDRGGTWVNIDSNLKGTTYQAALDATGTSLFVGTDNGLYRTDDNGASWSKIDLGLANKNLGVGAVHCRGRFVFALGPTKSIFISSDTGRSWTATTPILDSSIVFVGVK
jgi:hypothetical protein